jgi:hypothetical protein
MHLFALYVCIYKYMYKWKITIDVNSAHDWRYQLGRAPDRDTCQTNNNNNNDDDNVCSQVYEVLRLRIARFVELFHSCSKWGRERERERARKGISSFIYKVCARERLGLVLFYQQSFAGAKMKRGTKIVLSVKFIKTWYTIMAFFSFIKWQWKKRQKCFFFLSSSDD